MCAKTDGRESRTFGLRSEAPRLPVESTEVCSCAANRALHGLRRDGACQTSCIFDAITRGEDGSLMIDAKRCAGCGACIAACKEGKLAASRDILPAMRAVREPGKLSYALIAPAFLGQFSRAVTPGKLRSAFKALGFSGMVEVALFADILTLKRGLGVRSKYRDRRGLSAHQLLLPHVDRHDSQNLSRAHAPCSRIGFADDRLRQGH